MKKQVLIAAGLMALSTSAHATKARMLALGEDTEQGAFHISDTRNIFRNAAHVNTFKNYVVAEWGDASQADGLTTPQAEGGFFREFGSFSYGVYLGSQVNTVEELEAEIQTGTFEGVASAINNPVDENYVGNSNNIDVFFGGDMGVKWGVTLNYGTNAETQTGATPYDAEYSQFGMGLGVIAGMVEGYANLDFVEEYEGADSGGTNAESGDKLEGDFNFNLGIIGRMNNWTGWIDYDSVSAEHTQANAGTNPHTDEIESTRFQLGVGYNQEVTSAARVNYSIRYVNRKVETTDGATGGNGTDEVKISKLPLGISFEADATSWLTLRGSITQNFLIGKFETTDGSTGGTNNRDEDIPNSTDINAGATLTFGKLMVDGVIGFSDTDGNLDGNERGVLDTDRLLGRVAVHYWF